MRRRSKASGKLAKAQHRKAEIPRRRAAPRLARERGKYPRRDELRPTLETALDAVVVMKSDGVVADWNDCAAGVFGWSRDEAVGRIMADLIIPERYREAHRKGLRRYLESGKGEVVGRRIEVSGLRKNGEEFPVELSISPIQDRENILFIGFLRDITESHALRLARAELGRVTRRMAMGEMAASIAHEIKQPLAAISANGNAGLRWLTRATPDIERARAVLKRIVSDTQHASEVIDSIRSMFKNEGQAKTMQDVNELIRDALTLVRTEVENQHVSICTELSAELPQVPANQVQLRQVMVNLIANAVDAMSTVANRARDLRIKTEGHKLDGVLITVEDSGIGIEPQNLDRIFDAFFTTKPHGMGMGLSICRSIIESHDGRLSVAPAQPHGSIFHVSLPTGNIHPER
jgi:PAS domain S-box-containing protein